jgi:hypothetical protein
MPSNDRDKPRCIGITRNRDRCRNHVTGGGRLCTSHREQANRQALRELAALNAALIKPNHAK